LILNFQGFINVFGFREYDKMLILKTSGGLREGYLSWGVTVQ
jgi:hypothetical protein